MRNTPEPNKYSPTTEMAVMYNREEEDSIEMVKSDTRASQRRRRQGPQTPHMGRYSSIRKLNISTCPEGEIVRLDVKSETDLI